MQNKQSQGLKMPLLGFTKGMTMDALMTKIIEVVIGAYVILIVVPVFVDLILNVTGLTGVWSGLPTLVSTIVEAAVLYGIVKVLFQPA